MGKLTELKNKLQTLWARTQPFRRKVVEVFKPGKFVTTLFVNQVITFFSSTIKSDRK